ncbi:MAG: flagellar basal-body rod modification protein FlgD [Pseudonocardiales bacterium]|jgi:flagellar basal-body rod modification protein FlgD|nr:flagellar basal-body rod modification protein FlgD [Pseudonocardiales bacterium]
MTSPITASTAASPTPIPSTGSAATDNTQLSSQAFLQLLVAQLQYQDPSKPVDTSQFMNETATLTQVQTMESNSKATSQLLSAQLAQSASGLVGRTVSYLDAAGHPATGVVSAATISTSPPTLRIGSSDVGLSQIQQVLAAGS